MNVIPVPMCELCRRPVAWHGRKPKHQRPCGPLTGTAAGPMSPVERERYLAGTSR